MESIAAISRCLSVDRSCVDLRLGNVGERFAYIQPEAVASPKVLNQSYASGAVEQATATSVVQGALDSSLALIEGGLNQHHSRVLKVFESAGPEGLAVAELIPLTFELGMIGASLTAVKSLSSKVEGIPRTLITDAK